MSSHCYYSCSIVTYFFAGILAGSLYRCVEPEGAIIACGGITGYNAERPLPGPDKAVVTFEKKDEGWTITESHLKVNATVPGATHEVFAGLAQEAKAGCPVSRLLNATITMDAILVI
jgi:uncharacterized OsmC-like protein